MLSVSAPPTRTDLSAAFEELLSQLLKRAAFVRRVTPARVNRNGVFAPPVFPLQELFSTVICWLIIVFGTSPLLRPVPWFTTWIHTGTVTEPAARASTPRAAERSLVARSISSFSACESCGVPQPSRGTSRPLNSPLGCAQAPPAPTNDRA